MAQAQNKTQPEPGVSVDEFLASVENPKRREDALAVNELFRAVSGEEPVMWGPSIVGFGRHHYVYDSGREGDTPALGFSPRKTALVLYGLQLYGDRSEEVEALGPVKLGKGCVYVKDLSKLDTEGLKALAAKVYRERLTPQS